MRVPWWASDKKRVSAVGLRLLPVNLLPEESTLMPRWRRLPSQFLPSAGLSNRGMHATSQSSDFTLIAWMNHSFKTILKVLKPVIGNFMKFWLLWLEGTEHISKVLLFNKHCLNHEFPCLWMKQTSWGPDTQFFSSFSSSVLREIATFPTDSNTREHLDYGMHPGHT